MQLCCYNHDEVVYDCKHCPVCEALKLVDELEDKLKDLEDSMSEKGGEG